jgi:dTDP-4-dehydrorhamnose reductase
VTCPQLDVLVFGSRGQVGRELSSLLQTRGYSVAGFDREECDICSESSILKAIEATGPKAIVNAAAYTAVDRAESEPELAEQINSRAPGVMARVAETRRIPFIHYSTDYVFDGEKRGPWREEDVAAPLNVYGRTKLAGERAVLSACGMAFVFRTSWVFGAEGNNFVQTMLRLGQKRDDISVVCDQVGSPTWSRSLAKLTLFALQRLGVRDGPNFEWARTKSGLYHATGTGKTSWYGFACSIFEIARDLGIELSVGKVIPVTSSEHTARARRPRNSVLSNAKLNCQLGYALPEWKIALRAVLTQISRTSFQVPAAE